MGQNIEQNRASLELKDILPVEGVIHHDDIAAKASERQLQQSQLIGSQNGSMPLHIQCSGDLTPTQKQIVLTRIVSSEAHLNEENVDEKVAGTNQMHKTSACSISCMTQTSNSFPEQADPDEPIRPPSGVHREVIVAGDSNVALFARALSEEVGDPHSLEIMLNRGATLEQIHELIDTYEERARQEPRMYILHVGVNNILQGDQPDTIIECLRQRWAKRKAALAICSVPEIRARGKELQARTMMLNAKLKHLCQNIKARFIDFTRDFEDTNAVEKNDLHYRPLGVQMVTNRMGLLHAAF